MNNKLYYRTISKNIRKTLDMTSKSLMLIQKLRSNPIYKNSQNVMIYHPLKYEVDLLSLFEDNKNFFLPRVNGDNLEVCPYKIGEELNKSSYNIYEPVCNSVSANILDLVVVPALAVDKKGYRLGYGGGYYDRFLAKNPNIKTVVLIPNELLIEELPIDKYDIKIDCIIYT